MMRRHYRCPECGGVFVYDHHPSMEADPLPDDAACPHCSYRAAEYPRAVVAPHIGRPIRATVDNLMRDMEDGAEFRANIAREQMGLSEQEAMALKVTDARDNLREGDIAAAPVHNDVTRAMEAQPQNFGFQASAQGAAYSGAVQGGPFPNAGLHALNKVREMHPRLVSSTGHGAVVSTSNPDLGTLQPGYRKRL